MVAVRHAVRLPAMTRDVLAPRAEHNAITHSTVVVTETIHRPVPAALSGRPGASGAPLSRTGTAVQINRFGAALDGAHSGPWLRTYQRFTHRAPDEASRRSVVAYADLHASLPQVNFSGVVNLVYVDA
jgi:hypothetical protein